MNLIETPRLLFHNPGWKPYLEFAFIDYPEPGVRLVGAPLTMVNVGRGEIIQPTFKLDNDALNQLMNDMWVAGFRPNLKLMEPRNLDHMEKEVDWLRSVTDHLIKRKP